ncbi:hypothetical protein [Paenarthrobacter ureafaciens]|uniref:hypothetical protein n=1 Tax=Paenarthrobacter ureafaciens TaxID=37931 RepID=UPI0009AD4C57|nr:hypothetical protein [Paenarthrobacter ureafaciens]GLU58567.1 hypothetical protein Pure01_10800 [Paenarthrobacter ureafaciens]GLU61812.1 hypothetical protein Pure02_00620 [Paenarthrobacter ureafaciens]GLU66086.1 hypothetical protein Pure03_00620 [Paenarthrobacter ureafaciens]GLU71590.1 hypothetical protein Pure04_13050 [Paenarthrobacter ureafaciens]GLU74623.1 hypothetical protein Pure05_00630 [Paenarthrobacter ureafaciens]
MDEALQLAHDSIHAEYRQALADAQWALANANAQLKVKDAVIAARERKIAELEALLDEAATPQA